MIFLVDILSTAKLYYLCSVKTRDSILFWQGIVTLLTHRGKSPSPDSQHPQSPLPSNVIQLLSGSATQEVSDPNGENPSFVLYEIKIDEQLGTLRVDRTIYEHEWITDHKFTDGHRHTVIQQLDIMN